ncbi:LCP family protein [Iamia majanohamensis]|uniref:LCP family protein n=1 Tax=Iamia majanohamensis TaxID=467976 RepID=A0AAE9YCF2_9ACTN|nr:LCP family protein [Iamia majanohamensis]WCO68638.1 LCP family protein [Iamia majanohamensis]
MVTAIVFVVGLVQGLLVVGAVVAFRGRRTLTTDGRPGRRRGALRIGLGLVAVAAVLGLLAVEAGWFYAVAQWDKVERVDVDVDGESVLEGGDGGTNYLLVGTDNREGVDGNRSDTIMVLRTGDGPARILSLPRDLLVPIVGREDQTPTLINSAYNDGPVALILTVEQSVGIPIDRYIEIGFDSFAGVVDAVGGVVIDFPNPAFDVKSGLDVKQAGPVELNGEQALAYVRSRTFTEVIDGTEVTDPTGDLGRVQRQQRFLRAVLSEAGSSRDPFALNDVGQALLGGIRVDNHMTLVDALRFAWSMGQLDPQPTTLPTVPAPSDPNRLVLQQPEADALIQDFST